MKKVSYPIVEVEWVDILDHSRDDGYSEKEALELQTASEEHTVGYLISDSKDDGLVRIGNDYSTEDNVFRKVVVIPSFNVMRIIKLKDRRKFNG